MQSDMEFHRQICTSERSISVQKAAVNFCFGTWMTSNIWTSLSHAKEKMQTLQEMVQARDLNWHINNECANRQVKCGVENCDTWFHAKTQKHHLLRHEETHLNKLVQDWTPHELAFWLYRKFEFFRPADLEYYCNNIVANRIEGYMKVECEPGKLDSLLEKQVGIVNVNARGTVLQALGIGLQQGVKAGVFLDAAVRREVV